MTSDVENKGGDTSPPSLSGLAPQAEPPPPDAPNAPSTPPRARRAPLAARVAVGVLALAAAAGLVVYTVDARARRAARAAAQERADEAARAAALVADAPDALDAEARRADLAGDAGELASDAAPAAPPPPVWRLAEMKGDPAYDVVEAPIGKRPFSTALLASGVSRAEMNRVVAAFHGVRSFDRVSPKDTISLAKEKKTGHVVAFELASSPADVWQAREEDGALTARKLELLVERVRVAVGVVVGDDLRGSLVKAGLDDDLLDKLDDALEGHAELADLRPGARLRVVATEERIQGKFSRYVELDAVEYTPASGAAPTRVYHQTSGKAPGYYDGKGHQPYRGGWRSPVLLARVTSRYNPRRMHPVLHVVMPHNGVDFAASTGTPVFSAASGTVSSVGDGGACGNMVQIKHTNGLTSAYCHLSRFAAGLHAGEHVETRQLVGYAGQTGRVTGPHLHFAVKRGDIFIDPLALKLDGIKVLPHEDRDEFMKTRVELDGVLDSIVMSAPAVDAGLVPASTADAGAPDDTPMDEAP